MERAFSVEDLMGNWLRMGGAGFTRTDSEAAFQEWLKRIPSHNNLADAKFTDMLSFNQLSSAHSFQNLQSLGQPPGTLQAPEGLQVAPPTMPRVPSLDLLRQLVQHQSNANAVQSTPCSAAGEKQYCVSLLRGFECDAFDVGGLGLQRSMTMT